LLGRNAADFSVVVIDRRNFAVLDNLYAVFLRALCQRPGNVDRIGITVRRNMDAADDVVGVKQWRAILYFRLRNYVDFEAENLGHRRAAFELFETLIVDCNRYRPTFLIARGLPCLCFESLVQLARVLGQSCHVHRRT